MTDDDLTEKIIGCAYKVHNTLGPGFLEKARQKVRQCHASKDPLSGRYIYEAGGRVKHRIIG